MRFRRWHRPGIALLVSSLAGAGSALAQAPSAQAAPRTEPAVSPVTGPSWLTKLGVTLSQTSIGRGSGQYGPTTTPPPPPPAALNVPATVRLGGADLYRLNCQACHGLTGGGAPPEVSSAVDPVRGASLEALRKQMKAQHQPEGAAEQRAQPARVRAAVLTRMHQGGQRMPSRAHLTDAELDLVFGHLTTLAGGKTAGKTEIVGWARLGEHVVKGTCHICHDAVGARPGDARMMQGAIPSLQALLASATVADFVTKVHRGAPVTLPSIGLTHRGRMPVFDYLKNEEIAAAYMYLAANPPRR
jgi:mono/diheme cytochrome c family protein